MNKQILIISSCVEEWGGSEELWARTIPLLRREGFEVGVVKDRINRSHPKFRELARAGVVLKEVDTRFHKMTRLFRRLAALGQGLILQQKRKPFNLLPSVSDLQKKLLRWRPRLVIVAQGSNFDGLLYAAACNRAGIPYVIIHQKAVEGWWPLQEKRKEMAEALLAARKCFFVSRHNLELTEEQFGVRLPNASLVWNPVKVPVRPLAYPETREGYQLACIGRLWVFDKGQDMLLRVLSAEKWKNRALTVNFYGAGVDETALKELAALLGLERVAFKGMVEDMESLWAHHHALILPSRQEGLPLVILEAMALGRTVISTRAGGNSEILQDGITGFIGEANERSLEETLERAWERREEWPSIGLRASQYIREKVPASPENEFLSQLQAVW
ncbi:MAG: glycosyltransferase [Flavisolibacter sp.]